MRSSKKSLLAVSAAIAVSVAATLAVTAPSASAVSGAVCTPRVSTAAKTDSYGYKYPKRYYCTTTAVAEVFAPKAPHDVETGIVVGRLNPGESYFLCHVMHAGTPYIYTQSDPTPTTSANWGFIEGRFVGATTANVATMFVGCANSGAVAPGTTGGTSNGGVTGAATAGTSSASMCAPRNVPTTFSGAATTFYGASAATFWCNFDAPTRINATDSAGRFTETRAATFPAGRNWVVCEGRTTSGQTILATKYSAAESASGRAGLGYAIVNLDAASALVVPDCTDLARTVASPPAVVPMTPPTGGVRTALGGPAVVDANCEPAGRTPIDEFTTVPTFNCGFATKVDLSRSVLPTGAPFAVFDAGTNWVDCKQEQAEAQGGGWRLHSRAANAEALPGQTGGWGWINITPESVRFIGKVRSCNDPIVPGA